MAQHTQSIKQPKENVPGLGKHPLNSMLLQQIMWVVSDSFSFQVWENFSISPQQNKI